MQEMRGDGADVHQQPGCFMTSEKLSSSNPMLFPLYVEALMTLIPEDALTLRIPLPWPCLSSCRVKRGFVLNRSFSGLACWQRRLGLEKPHTGLCF